MAVITITPATMTARPAVDIDVTTDSSGARPWASPSRCRVTISSA